MQLRAALQRGHLTRQHRVWRYGRRQFSNETVRRAIARGEAVLVGNRVFSA